MLRIRLFNLGDACKLLGSYEKGSVVQWENPRMDALVELKTGVV